MYILERHYCLRCRKHCHHKTTECPNRKLDKPIIQQTPSLTAFLQRKETSITNTEPIPQTLATGFASEQERAIYEPQQMRLSQNLFPPQYLPKLSHLFSTMSPHLKPQDTDNAAESTSLIIASKTDSQHESILEPVTLTSASQVAASKTNFQPEPALKLEIDPALQKSDDEGDVYFNIDRSYTKSELLICLLHNTLIT